MEFLEMDFFDDDIFKLMFRFGINLIFLVSTVIGIYYMSSKRKEYVFSFFMINVLVFLICFTLKKFELELGMALGLFALFGILRYRTAPIPIREMTYLFVVIGIAVINSLSNKKMSYIEIIFTNLAIVVSIYILESIFGFGKEAKKRVLYENIHLVRNEHRKELIADLQARTGLKINRVEIGDIDFLRDTAKIMIYYNRDQSGHIVVHESTPESYPYSKSID